MKRVEEGVLREVEGLRVGRRWLVGRPRKRWKGCVMEDMNILGIEEYMAQDREMWRTVIARPTPS